MEKQQTNKFFLITKYILFFGLFYLLFKADINNTLNPFYFGMFFALVWCNQNILLLSPLYILASYLNNFYLYDLYSAVAMCVVMLIIYGIHKKLKKPIKPMLLLLYSIISLSVSVFLKLYTGIEPWIVFVELTFGLLYMFSAMKIFESFIVRGLCGKFTITQIICGGVVLVSFGTGISHFYFFDFDFAKLILSFVVIFTTLTLPPLESLSMCSILAFGTCLSANNPYLVTPVVIWWLVATCFRGRHRIFVSLSLLVTEFMCTYYFNFYYSTSYLVYLPCIISAVCTLIIPQKVYSKLTEIYNSGFVNRGLDTIINRNRKNIHTKLLNLSNVFSEMDKIFRSTIKGSATQEELKQLLVSELKNKMCESCPERNRCHKIYGDETSQTFFELANVAFNKGKITLLDIPSVFTGRCFKINQLVYATNDLMEQYKSYASLVSNIDASKVMISEQFYGVSNVLKDLSKEVGKQVSFDDGLEREIIDTLLYNDIVCCDAMVYHDNMNITDVTLEVKKEDRLKSKIAQIVSNICKIKMIVETENTSEHKGWQILNLKTAPKYDIIFGTSAITKASSKSSGDSYSLIRMENGKILMALCDGMGSGEKAQRASSTAISLVENFYKAGFDSDVILSIVNKFLSISNNDVFSCLDMAIIDLKNGSGDFIKLGATNGYIKHNDTVSVISSQSLPLGIISSVSPTIKSVMFERGDFVILCTDGVSDSFSSDEEMKDFVNNIDTFNPQEIADQLLDKALKNNNGAAVDDMTILVCKIF